MTSESFKLTQLSSKRIINIIPLENLGLTAKISTRDFNDIAPLLRAIKVSDKHVMAEQVHGNNINAVSEKDAGTVIKDVDALITDRTNLPLVIRTADCIPVFIFDPVKRAIGLTHAGWRGSIGNIAGKTIEKMIKTFKITPSDCIIAIGTAINKECYEVSSVVVDRLKKEVGGYEKYITGTDKDHWLFDIKGLNADQLTDKGIKRENILVDEDCTHCRTDMFFSCRKEGIDTGRIFSVLMIKE